MGENSFTQRLADVVRKNERRDIPVEAPTGYVNYNTVSIGGDISYRTVPSLVGSGPGTYYTIPNEKLDWVTFHGRRNHAK